MNQHARTEELSMDEILASVRKIMAEEGPKSLPLPASPLIETARSEPASAPVTPEAPASLSSKLNEAFGYVPGADAARTVPAPARARPPIKAAIDDELADLLSDQPVSRSSAPAAEMPAPAQASPAFASAPSSIAKAPSAPKTNPSLFAPEPPVAVAPAAPKAPEPAPLPTTAAAEPAKPGPIVIAAAPRVKPSIEATLAPRSTPAAPPPPALSSLTGVTVQPAAPAPAAKPAPFAPVVLAAMPPIAKDNTAQVQPAPAISPGAEPGAGPVMDEGGPPASKSAEAAPVKDEASAEAVASALGNLDAGLAASSRPIAPEIVVTAVEVAPASKSPVVEGAPGTGVTTGAASVAFAPPHSATPGESVFSKPSAFIGGVALTPIKSFDDTAAELLRPMLRDWLDSNMPRIVERALKIEMAGGQAALPKPADASDKPSGQG